MSTASTTIGGNYNGHDTRQTTSATLGNGNVKVGGQDIADTSIEVNRDVENAQEITQDHQLGGLDASVTVDHRLVTEKGRNQIANDFEDTAELAKDVGKIVADGADYVYDEIQTIGDNLPEKYRDRLGDTGEEFIDELIQQDFPDEQILSLLESQKMQDGLAAVEQSSTKLESGESSVNTEEVIIYTFVSGQEVDGVLQLEPQLVTSENVDLDSPTSLEVGLAGLGKVKQEVDSVRSANPELAKGIEVAIGVATGGPLKEGINQVVNAGLENIYGSEVIEDVKNEIVNYIGGTVTGDKEVFEPLANIDKQYPNENAAVGDSFNDIRDGTEFVLGTLFGIGGKGGSSSVGIKKDSGNREQQSQGPVQELEVDGYKDLKKREVVGDNLEHDHIPSAQATIRAEEKRLGRELKPEEKRYIYNNATAIERTKDSHKQGPTHSGKNTQKQIDKDSNNLANAACRDCDSLRKTEISSGKSPIEVDNAINDVHNRNVNHLKLYTKEQLENAQKGS
jgi:transcription elongation factor Elf1